jgi:hypothetical protein
VALFYSRRAGLIALAVLAALFAEYTFAAAEFTMPAWRDSQCKDLPPSIYGVSVYSSSR